MRYNCEACYVLRVTCYVLRVTCYVLREACHWCGVVLPFGEMWRDMLVDLNLKTAGVAQRSTNQVILFAMAATSLLPLTNLLT